AVVANTAAERVYVLGEPHAMSLLIYVPVGLGGARDRLRYRRRLVPEAAAADRPADARVPGHRGGRMGRRDHGAGQVGRVVRTRPTLNAAAAAAVRPRLVNSSVGAPPVLLGSPD